MFINRSIPIAATLCLMPVAAPGCVERNEWITVARDGSVSLRIEYEGTEHELQNDDAMPSAAGGWVVQRAVKMEKDQETVILTGQRHFAPGEDLPSTYAAESDPDADLYLSFPTTIRTVQRPDGVYYYFYRVYTPRRWAFVQHWHDVLFDDEVKKLSEKPAEELTLAEQSRILEALARFEAFKELELAKMAVEQGLPNLPVEDILVAGRKLMNRYELELGERGENGVRSGLLVEALRECEMLGDDDKDRCIDDEAQRILDAGLDTFVRSLRHDAGLNDAEIDSFMQAHARTQREYAITNVLAGHAFEIDVSMPGTIIAHNAVEDDVQVSVGSSTIQFKFDGKAFRDRKHELIVVSKVEIDRGDSRKEGRDGSER